MSLDAVPNPRADVRRQGVIVLNGFRCEEDVVSHSGQIVARSTDLGKHVTVARRRGSDWYIANMSGPRGVSRRYPLDFLTSIISGIRVIRGSKTRTRRERDRPGDSNAG